MGDSTTSATVVSPSFKVLKMLLRKHFYVPNVQTYIPGTDLRKVIIDELLLLENTVTLWEEITHNTPSHYEKHSVELLKNVP